MLDWIELCTPFAEVTDRVEAGAGCFSARIEWRTHEWMDALSPIDLIPDFIPVLGYVDDLLILPLGIWAAIKLIPRPLMDGHRVGALRLSELPVSKIAAMAIIAIWVGAAVGFGVCAALLHQ